MKRRKISLKYRFWFHYVFVALIACVIAGLVIYSKAGKQLEKSIYSTAAAEMNAAAAYLENQVSVFKDISSLVSSDTSYRRTNRDLSEENKWQVIQNLKKFINFTPLAESYFLYYRGEDNVWKPGAMNSVSAYSHVILKIEASELLKEYLESIDDLACFPIEQRIILVSIPLHLDSTHRVDYDATLTFSLKQTTIEKQLAIYMPDLYKAIDIRFAEQPFHQAVTVSDEGTFVFDDNAYWHTEDSIKVYSPEGLFSIAVYKADIPSMRLIKNTNPVSITIILLIVAVIAVFAYILASITYRPIKQLLHRHQMLSDSALQDELTRIDVELTRFSVSEEKLKEQTRQIHILKKNLTEQFFLRLLSGQSVSNPENRANDLGLYLPGSLFQAVRICWDAPLDKNRISRAIEQLSDTDDVYFPVDYNAGSECIVVMNATDEEHLATAYSMLEELGSSGDFSFSIHEKSEVCENLSSLSLALPFQTIQETSSIILAGIYQNNPASALKAFDLFIEKTEYLPNPQQKFVTSELFMTLISEVNTDEEIGLRITKTLAIDSQEVRNNELRNALNDICISVQSMQENPADNVRILQYINTHLSNPNLDLYTISNDLNLPQRMIRDILKEQTGMYLREYLNKKRVEAAAKLLDSTELSVAEIASSVGYSSVSYFIKNFHDLRGDTPAAWRERKKSDMSNSNIR